MKREMLLKITGLQRFQEEAPERTELTTEGVLWHEDGAVLLSYQESALTGMEGTKTTFRIEPHRVVLTRTGAIKSQMIFLEGQEDCSLYDTGFGALMIAVRTERIDARMGDHGGTLHVTYTVSVEDGAAGRIDYSIHARPKEIPE